jgi:tRNA acetyltransferase TAN1
MKVILKTDIGIERIVLSRLKDLDIPCSLPPDGLRGILLVDKAGPETAKQLDSIPEITTILPIDAECPSNLEAIVKAGTSSAQTRLQSHESFAVRTVRRSKQAYSSMDVSIGLGAAIVEALGCPVDLDTPDQVVHVDIIEDRTYISIVEGTSQHKKKGRHCRYPGSQQNRDHPICVPVPIRRDRLHGPPNRPLSPSLRHPRTGASHPRKDRSP